MVLILGASGMLGHRLALQLQDRPELRYTVRGRFSDSPLTRFPALEAERAVEGFEALDLDAVRRTLRQLRPAVVVNALGVIKQRRDAASPVPVITINALLPHVLAEELQAWEGRLIHVSTDCVFSGRRGRYTEDDPSDAVDLYGRSKYLGEVSGPRCLTLRTSIIGHELRHFGSLLEWFCAQDGGRVRGFTRAIYSGLTTPHLAGLIERLLDRHPDLDGLYHVASQAVDKATLLGWVRDAYGLQIEIEPDDSVVIDRSLDGSRFAAAADYICPPWEELIAQLARERGRYD